MNYIKSFLILLSATLVMTGCQTPAPESYWTLNNHVINNRYYFHQGYRENWETEYDPEEYALDKNTLLLLEMYPKDSDGKAIYSIYTGDTELITTTHLETAHNLINTESSMNFNTKFIKDEHPREDFKITNSEMKTVIYNRLHYKQISYSFVNDGEDWTGDLYIVMDGSKYFILTWERASAIKDKYQEQFIETITDFRFIGFEDDK